MDNLQKPADGKDMVQKGAPPDFKSEELQQKMKLQLKDLPSDPSHPDTSIIIAPFLSRYGYLPEDFTASDVPRAFAEYQKRHGIPQTGVLDDQSKCLMSQPRCSHPDVSSVTRDSNGELRFPTAEPSGTPWPSRALTFSIDTYPTGQTQSGFPGVDRAVQTGLNVWSQNTNLAFTRAQGSGNPIDFHIQWLTGQHVDSQNRRCSYAFDGDSWFFTDELAHGYIGYNSVLPGDMHLDDDNNWFSPVAIQATVSHEGGHLLGLQHSDDSDDMMYATQSFFRYRTELSANDIAAIQALYPS